LPIKVDYFVGIKFPKGAKVSVDEMVEKWEKFHKTLPKGIKSILSVVLD